MKLGTQLFHRPGRVTAVLTAAALLAVVSPAATPRSLAQTAPSDPTPSSGPPAPAGFAADLTRIFEEATAVPPPPGSDAQAPPMSGADFHQNVGNLTQDQLNAIYNTNPSAWPQVISTVDAYSSTVSAIAAGAAAQPAGAPPASPNASPGDLGPPVLFTPVPCPLLALGGPGGGFYQIYALQIAQQAVQLSSDLLGATAAGLAGDALIEALSAVVVPPEVATVAGTLLSRQAIGLASAILATVASAIAIPIDVIQFLLNRAIGSCQYDNATAEVPVIDANAVAAHHNVDAAYELSQQNLTTDKAIDQLLDTRTQTIVNQLNTAQASLDQALRHSIEQALAGGNTTTIVSYQLPASLGGYLDSTPVGVQAIVTSTLAMMQAAKQSIAPSAPDNLANGNKALAAGQYKQAFSYYQTAYGLLTR